MVDVGRLRDGARNLLFECGQFVSGDRLLIVCEDPALGWYDAEAPRAVAEEARRCGMDVEIVRTGAPTNSRDDNVSAIVQAHRNIVYFARLGDQDRFGEARGKNQVMTYVRSAAMLASDYGCASHRAMMALKDAVNRTLLAAELIEITCPRGTRVSGTVSQTQSDGGDVSVRRFPMGVPVPLLAEPFSGDVVLADYLTPTGSRVYEPPCLALDEPVIAKLDRGRIAGLSGPARSVAAVRAHYELVSRLFGIDPDFVHSWHAGIHPGVRHHRPAADDPDLWSNTVFTSPRYLHFHTCGAYPPGEICWMVADPTIAVDDVPLWQDGFLRPQSHSLTVQALAEHPALQSLFAD